MEITQRHPVVRANVPDATVMEPPRPTTPTQPTTPTTPTTPTRPTKPTRATQPTGWGFRIAATGVVASGVAFLGGVAWNVSDTMPLSEQEQACVDTDLPEAYARGVLVAIDEGRAGEITADSEITFENEDGTSNNVPVTRIRDCVKAFDDADTFAAQHKSRPLIIGGLVAGLVSGGMAFSSTPSSRISKRHKIQDLSR